MESFSRVYSRLTRRLSPAVLALVCLGGVGHSWAGPQAVVDPGEGVVIERVEVGFGGYFKVGNWSPLFVTVKSATARSARMVVEVLDPDEHIVEMRGPMRTLAAGQPQRVQSAFRSGRFHGEITVRVEDDTGRVLATRRMQSGDEHIVFRPALRQDVLLWTTLGHPPGFESGPLLNFRAQADAAGKPGSAAESSAQTDASAHVQVMHLESASALPGAEQGRGRRRGRLYESLDTLVLALGEKPPHGDDWLSQLTADQNAALRDWVRTGGHLVLAVGARAADYRSSLLAEWVPVVVQRNLSELRQLAGLETFSKRNQALSFPGTVKAAKLDASALSDRHVLVQGADGPLLVRVPYGLGRVTLLGLDITQPPLANWKALGAVCRKIASDSRSGASARREQRQEQLGRRGVTDLASQLHAAQDRFATVNRPSIWSVMGLILAYIVVLGPLDYFVVQRLLGRSTWTWVTFPLLVCLASAASLWAAARWNGDAMQVNQMDVLDVVEVPAAEGGQIVRGRTWFNVFSPKTAAFRVEVEAAWLGVVQVSAPQPAAEVSWSGVPEDVVGGMYRLGGLNLSRRRYRADETAGHLDGVPIAVWSSKGFEATWEHAAKQLVTSSLESAGVGRLEGTISHALPMPLEDCLLAFGGRLYRLGGGGSSSTLAPDQEWTPSQQGHLRDLKAFLTNTIAQVGEKKDKLRGDVYVTETPYDSSGTNLDELLRMLTFHQAAGGSSYTGLNHDLLRSLDLSDVMLLGRAVLIGRIKPPAAKVLVNGQAVEPAERATYVRFVVPVRQVRGDEK